MSPYTTEAKPPGAGSHLRFRKFSAIIKTWDAVFTEAAEFATEQGPTRVVSISHSHNSTESVVTVWYWSDT